jgi:hypothetical protein
MSTLPSQPSPICEESGLGHQGAFLRPTLDAGYGFSEGPLAGTQGNGREAPKLLWIPPALASEMSVTLTSGG